MECRICFDSDNPHDMVSPCLCAGSIAYIHRTCLHAEQRHRREEWLRTGRLHCTICHTDYDPHYLVQEPKLPIPEIVMSSFIQLCVMVCYVLDSAEDTTLKGAILACLAINIAASFVWVRMPIHHSVVQHFLIHATSLLLLVKRGFPDFDWRFFPPAMSVGAVTGYFLEFIARARQDQLESFSLFSVILFACLEYLFVVFAFYTSVRDMNCAILFTMAFTNVCGWGHSATRVYARPR